LPAISWVSSARSLLAGVPEECKRQGRDKQRWIKQLATNDQWPSWWRGFAWLASLTCVDNHPRLVHIQLRLQRLALCQQCGVGIAKGCLRQTDADPTAVCNSTYHHDNSIVAASKGHNV
jgi:hypothetical protein